MNMRKFIQEGFLEFFRYVRQFLTVIGLVALIIFIIIGLSMIVLGNCIHSPTTYGIGGGILGALFVFNAPPA